MVVAFGYNQFCNINFNYIISFDYHDNFLKRMRNLNDKFEI